VIALQIARPPHALSAGMTRRSLDRLRVLTPCPLATTFNEPVSHCQACGRDVLDLSALTREEAAAVLSRATPPCVRFVLSEGRPVFRTTLIALAATAVAAANCERVRAKLSDAITVLREAPVVTGGVIAPGKWK
jgi:hypothetical protein